MAAGKAGSNQALAAVDVQRLAVHEVVLDQEHDGGGSLLHRNDLLQRQPCAELRDIAAAGVAERAAQQRGVGGAG